MEEREYRRLEEETTYHILRLGGWAAIIGSLLAGIGNLLHPETPLNDDVGVARAIAESDIWVAVHLVIVFGVILMLGGLVALHRSIRGGLASALAHLGLAAGIAGVAVGALDVILDGVAAPVLAEQWATAAADQQDAALRVVLAQETLNFAAASLFNFLFAGATFILFGLAVTSSSNFPTWLGWIATVAGVVSIGAGLVQAFIGAPTTASRILTIIGPSVITAWLIGIGYLMVRRAATSKPPDVASS